MYYHRFVDYSLINGFHTNLAYGCVRVFRCLSVVEYLVIGLGGYVKGCRQDSVIIVGLSLSLFFSSSKVQYVMDPYKPLTRNIRTDIILFIA